jgi:hypothetical protein
MYIPLNKNSRSLAALKKKPTARFLLFEIISNMDIDFKCYLPSCHDLGMSESVRFSARKILESKGFIKTWCESRTDGLQCKLQPYCDIIDQKAFKAYLIESGIIEPVRPVENSEYPDPAENLPVELTEKQVLVNGKSFDCPDWLETATLQSWCDHLETVITPKNEAGFRINATNLAKDLKKFKSSFNKCLKEADQNFLYITYTTRHNSEEFNENNLVKYCITEGCRYLSDIFTKASENPQNTISEPLPYYPTPSTDQPQNGSSNEFYPNRTRAGQEYPQEWKFFFDYMVKKFPKKFYFNHREDLFELSKMIPDFKLATLKKEASKIALPDFTLELLLNKYHKATAPKQNKSKEASQEEQQENIEMLKQLSEKLGA